MELQYERGAYFKENSYPTVRGFAVIETTENLHGEPGYRIAEKDTEDDTWRDYWVPARHIHDEVGIGAAEKAGELSEKQVAAVEKNVSLEPADEPRPPEEVTRVKDVMDPKAVEAIIGANE